MPSKLESQMLIKLSEPLMDYATQLDTLFPQMEWNLKRSGFTLDSSQYLAIVLYLTSAAFTLSILLVGVPMLLSGGVGNFYLMLIFSIGASAITLFYLLLVPVLRIRMRAGLIDRDLEYMLKDIQIQLSAGIPLFDTLVNIVRGGYGECSRICEGIIQEVQQGKSMEDVLDDVGMWSPSEYLRRMLWQIVNALKSGSDVSSALGALSDDIRLEKENRIKSYGKELNLYGLIYLMLAIIMPSMGVTLLTILSSFLGAGMINETLFWVIMAGLIVFQFMFLSYVRSRRPIV